MSTPHPHTILFARGTLARLALWPALRLAVHASWGGPASAEKQRWLAGVLVDQFEPFLLAPPAPVLTPRAGSEPPPPDDIYVEELLLQIMDDEFEVALEDGSAAAVARDVVKLFEAVCAGDETFVKELEAQADKVRGQVPKYEMSVGSGSDSGSGSEWEDEEGETESDGEPAPQLLNHSEPSDEGGATSRRGRVHHGQKEGTSMSPLLSHREERVHACMQEVF
ncbi:Pre-rRNA-processing protein TSR2-domain-containing protein [Boletus coccyginus]|nr:Pre-rRNA-processing protein TSR2-domain-containing protein [Boletus coccyginus]